MRPPPRRLYLRATFRQRTQNHGRQRRRVGRSWTLTKARHARRVSGRRPPALSAAAGTPGPGKPAESMAVAATGSTAGRVWAADHLECPADHLGSVADHVRWLPDREEQSASPAVSVSGLQTRTEGSTRQRHQPRTWRFGWRPRLTIPARNGRPPRNWVRALGNRRLRARG